MTISFNVNTTTGFKSPTKLLNGLSEIKRINRSDLHKFLQLDHTSFTTLSVSTKHIESTDRISVTLSKPSAQVFYLDQKKPKSATPPYSSPSLPDDCLKDAQNCQYFTLFSSKERRLYTRFLDKVEANFEGQNATPTLFLTLTFNTTHDNYSAFTTNTDPNDDCWEPIQQKNSWLKDWAQNFDPHAEPMKIKIKKVPQEHATQLNHANLYLAKFLRNIRLKWKPSHWKWVVVAELQKNKNWHFHFLSTPIVPYSHKCVLDKDFTACWNCRAYLSELWPWGRVESKSPGKKTISKYLAKYLSKSFHLRSLYQQHGMEANHKTYRFFKNLYEYEQKSILLIGKHKLDAQTGLPLPKNQKVFRHYNYQTHQTSYFYRTNETLTGKCSNPVLIKKNYRLGTRSLKTQLLLNLALKSSKKEAYLWKRPKKKDLTSDFQEFLITRLLLLCHKAEFIHLPLEQERVSKENGQCDGLPYTHFQTKPVLRFQFTPQNAKLIRAFIDKLDDYAQEFDLEESKDFLTYPITHTQKHQTIKNLGGLCGCETRARNQYLNNWTLNYPSDLWRRTPM